MDFLLDQDTWDLLLAGGKLAEVTDPLQEIKQRVAIALKTQLGEWQYDISRGLPWLEEILVKGPSVAQIHSRIMAYLLSIEGITRVKSLEIAHSHTERLMVIETALETAEGVTGPFRIKVTT